MGAASSVFYKREKDVDTKANVAPDGQQPPDDLISARKAARILGVHFGTLYRWISRGRLRWKAFELVRVSEAEVRAILKRKPAKAGAGQGVLGQGQGRAGSVDGGSAGTGRVLTRAAATTPA